MAITDGGFVCFKIEGFILRGIFFTHYYKTTKKVVYLTFSRSLLKLVCVLFVGSFHFKRLLEPNNDRYVRLCGLELLG